METKRDITVIGGGIVGLATAYALQQAGRQVMVLEAEAEVAAHQTGHNSGVIHSGLYYKPGSLKAANCTSGREAMYRFCAENNISHDRCGKIVVAVDELEIPALDELERRGRANGLEGIKRLSSAELTEYEPHVAGVDGLWVPQTGIVDFIEVCKVLAQKVTERGGEVLLNSRVVKVVHETDGIRLVTSGGEHTTTYLVNCCGLQCDRVARMCGVDPQLRIVPFKGEYYELRPKKHDLVNNLIYPVPDPQFPFLGVHFTRMIDGSREAGPNAVLAFKREGYRKFSFSLKDSMSIASYGGFWKMASKHWKMSLGEFHRSFSKKAFVKALQRLVPEIQEADVLPCEPGIRAQALEPDGNLADDFRIIQQGRMVHVLNAPSPAATASLGIGRHIADLAGTQFG
ncbi:MAG: L-2-hydroxyglutarate oxidase [Kiritimatiellales bacterium]|nr:L-2-hydroxyglutarate oxidase [Kiritimatiellales bacterium]